MKFLFITHDASRTGAPILLLDFIRWIITNTDHEVVLLYRVGGDLEEEFDALVDTNFYYPKSYNKNKSLLGRVLKYIGYNAFFLRIHHKLLLRKYSQMGIDLIYGNTVVTHDVIHTLEPLEIPVVTHIRELESSILYAGGKDVIRTIDRLSNRIIADSNAVSLNLSLNYAIKAEKIDVVLEYINVPENLPGPMVSNRIRRDYGIPDSAFVVGASGSGIWRKGYDVFLQTAIACCNTNVNKDVYFIWVGGFSEEIKTKLEFDLINSGVQSKVFFVGQQDKPLEYFSVFDLFFLTSREEPFGIVGMESALFETPIICFEGSGGMPEFIQNDCGIVIPYLDIPNAVKTIEFLKNDLAENKRLGMNARDKVLREHTTHVKALEILNILLNQL